MQQSEQINDLATALSAAQGEFPTIPREREVEVKTKTGGSYSFRYAEFSTIRENIQPVLTKHGLGIVQGTTVTANGGTILATTLMHKSGQWIRGEMPVKCTEEGAQAFGSALTYSKRYALTSMLGLATEEDDDGNGADGNTMNDKEPPSEKVQEFKSLVAQASAKQGLSDNERKFVEEQHEKVKKYGDKARLPTDKQLAWLKSIAERPAKGAVTREAVAQVMSSPPKGHPALDDEIIY